jgi:hypothetical protein
MKKRNRRKRWRFHPTRPRRKPPTAWHLPFGALVEERSPSWIVVDLETLLQRESQRIDQLYTLHAKFPRDVDDQGRVMRGLWKHIHVVGIGEFKSISGPLVRGDVYRLVACGWHWLSRHPTHKPSEIVLVLMLPKISAPLMEELALCNATLVDAGNGYSLTTIYGLQLVVVEIESVAEAEQDDWLRVFGGIPVKTKEVLHWLRRHTNILENTMDDTTDITEDDEFVIKLAQSLPVGVRLAGLAPEERLAGLAPEARLADLGPEEQILALSDHVIRGFSKDFLATLSQETQHKIRDRLTR